jgi:hypothetical protein
MLRYVLADLGLEVNPVGVDPSAQAEFSAGTRRFTPLPTAAGGAEFVEENPPFGFERSFCGPETDTGRALRHLNEPLSSSRPRR